MAEDASGIKGEVTITLVGPDGEVKHEETIENLVTTAGDEYYTRMGMALVQPANAAQPTKVTGMKLGTGSTAAAKSGAGAALVTYEAASNNLFDATFPTASAVAGTDTGWEITYRVTWAAGDVTEAALREAVIVNDAATDATTSAANTIARVVFSNVDKGVDDTLIITWKHKFLGA